MRVHLVDGTYELFRHHFGQPPRAASDGTESAATRGVLQTVVAMIGDGATHIGVATDHVVESFRNDMWPGYKTGEGIAPELKAQFPLLEEGLGALGVKVWAMVELEADDALASAAAVATEDKTVDQVIIYTPDKDLAQCVDEKRVVQFDRRKQTITDVAGVWERFGVGPPSVPDWLALVGDSADGFPGLKGWGPRSASEVLGHYEHLEAIPDDVRSWDDSVRRSVRGAKTLSATLASQRDLAMLFRDVATLRVDRSLLGSVEELVWPGPTAQFSAVCAYLRDETLYNRAMALAGSSG